MHVVVRLVSKVAMPEVNCVFARQVVRHAEHLRRDLSWTSAYGSSLPRLLFISFQE